MPAISAEQSPVMIVGTYGVLNLGCIFEKLAGSNPYFAIEKNMRGCPISITKTTEVRPASAPILINGRSHNNDFPALSMEIAIGAETFNSL